MDSRARLGRRVLLAIIVVTALIQLALAVLMLQAGRFRGTHVGRELLTGWLLWKVWDGAGWARWLMAGLFSAGAALGAALVIDLPADDRPPEIVVLLGGLVATYAAFSVGLASPWVGAYQADRRGSPGD